MDRAPASLLRFVAVFLPAFLALLSVYPIVLPYWQGAAVAGANAITAHFSPPTRIEVTERAWQAWVTGPDGTERRMTRFTDLVENLIFLGLALLPALLVATPAPIATRLKLLGLGLLLLFPTHVLAVIGLVRGKHCLLTVPGTFSCLWLMRLVYASGQLTAALWWVLLTWRHWVRLFRPDGSVDRATRPPSRG